jgi:N-acyl-D-amino-acid deacylase
MLDLILQNGDIIDGRNQPRYRADIGIKADRIVEIGDLSRTESEERIDIIGQCAAPGFIDVHAHSDGWLRLESNFFPKTHQGFTTEILMVDGISYAPVTKDTVDQWVYYLRALNGLRMEDYHVPNSLVEYMMRLDQKTAQNTATHIPYANIRSIVHGFHDGQLDKPQTLAMQNLIAEGMQQGAVGLSTGLDYIAQCYSQTQELINACRAIQPFQGIYVSHVRYKSGLIEAVKEAVEIGKEARVGVHISHLKGQSPEEVEKLLNYINQTAGHEVDFTFDLYPYQSSSTMLNYLLPYSVWDQGPLRVIDNLRNKDIRKEFSEKLKTHPFNPQNLIIAWTMSRQGRTHQGKSLSEYAAETDRSIVDAICDLLIEENLAVLMVIRSGDDRWVDPMFQHECCMMATDGIYFPECRIHPREFGSVGRLLGPMVRERKLFSLEKAIHMLTSMPAERFRLEKRGSLKVGNYADIVVFNPKTIQDMATYTEPNLSTTGIDHVLVNGKWIIRKGTPVPFENSKAPGRYLRMGKSA